MFRGHAIGNVKNLIDFLAGVVAIIETEKRNSFAQGIKGETGCGDEKMYLCTRSMFVLISSSVTVLLWISSLLPVDEAKRIFKYLAFSIETYIVSYYIN